MRTATSSTRRPARFTSANMHLSPDGTKLTVRGYIGLSIFGRSQTWNRFEMISPNREIIGSMRGCKTC